MLSEISEATGIAVLVVSVTTAVVMLVLGIIVVIRARPEDLPEIVKGLAMWFRRNRK